MFRLFDFICSNTECNHIYEDLVELKEDSFCPKCGYVSYHGFNCPIVKSSADYKEIYKRINSNYYADRIAEESKTSPITGRTRK